MPQKSLITISTRHQSHYERLKSAEVKKFDDFLIKMDKDIRDKLSGSNLTDFTVKRLNAKIKQIGSLMNGTLDDYKKVWKESVKEAAVYEAGFESRALGQVVEGVNFTLPSDNQIAAAVFSTPLGDIGGASGGSLLDAFFDDMSATQVKRIEGAIRMGYAQGETTAQVVRRIRGTKAGGFKDGILAITKRNADAVARTALQHAASQAREEVWRQNSDIVEKVKWVSALDSKTSAICRSLDGQEFPIDKGIRPPAHVNCRSAVVGVLNNKWEDIFNKGATRSARDPKTGKVGSVKAKTTYYDWMKNQPAKVQDSIVGKSRGKLLRNGGISSERFAELQMGKNFEPLTLDEMRKLDPVAFEKAGL
tara:strand:- start:544 stop:1632 length:1089 start_codon:yes stop_codon:yes gene_type:complete